MKLIEFENKNTREVYNDYIRRIERTTKSLSEKDREDVLMELNSYIYEYVQENRGKDEMANLLEIIKRIGAPEEVLPPVIADKKMEQATRTFNPKHVFKALVLNITNGFSFVIFSVLYLLLFCFGFLAVAKIFFRRMWVSSRVKDGFIWDFLRTLLLRVHRIYWVCGLYRRFFLSLSACILLLLF